MIASYRFVPVARPGRSVGEARIAPPAAPARVVRLGVVAAMLLGGVAWAAGPTPPAMPPKGMPQPCAGAACGTHPNPTVPFVTGGSGAATWTYDAARNTLNIQQTTDRAILNWSNFDVTRGGKVNFAQPGASSATLNRIWQGNPSVIAGQITAPGQVYLLNQNGIVFGSGAQVNVGALLASSLNLRDSDFLGSLFNAYQQGQPLLSNVAADGTIYAAGAVSVEKGALLQSTGTGGRILLAAPNVSNAGDIQTPDGQAALAAGNLIYVSSDSTNPALRGLTIALDQGGVAANLGNILAQRGNVTIAGLTVNQSGSVRATSSVNFNGSVYLVAGDQPKLVLGRNASSPQHGGDLTLAAGSRTEVLPELTDTATSLDTQLLTPGIVSLQGRNVHLAGNAAVAAPGAQVSIRARSNLAQDDSARETTDAGNVVIDSGATIDVSGTRNVAVPVTRNFVDVQLRSNELQDSPLQRGGFLQGKTVTIDLRGVDANGNIPLANIAGFSANVPRTIAERTAAAGNIGIAASGAVVVRDGAKLDVSGGSIDYSGGYADTTKLIGANGRVYDIMTAPKDIQYTGFANAFTRSHPNWGYTETWQSGSRPYVAGYVEGRDAGAVSFLAPTVVLDGSILAATTRGTYQRDPAAALQNANQLPPGPTRLPLGGQFTLGDAAAAGDPLPDFQLADILLTGKLNTSDGALSFDDIVAGKASAGPTQILLPGLVNAGVSRLAFYGNGNVGLAADAGVRLPEAGSILLEGNRVTLDANIAAPAGTVTALAIATADHAATPFAGLAANRSIDVRGRWVNDSKVQGAVDRTLAKAIDGGRVTIKSQGDIDLAAGSSIDASGGGYLSNANVLTAGAAGSIAIQKSLVGPGQVTLGGSLSAYGLVRGGSLTVAATSVQIGGSAAPGSLLLDAGFFSRGGFASYAVTGIEGVKVMPGTLVDARAENFVPSNGLATYASGSDLAAFAAPALLPDDLRHNPVKLTLAAADLDQGFTIGRIDVGRDARISTDAGGSIALVAPGSIAIDGTLQAPAGSIRLAIDPQNLASGINTDPFGFRDAQSIWLGSHARLDAPGAALVTLDRNRLRSGGLINDGGSSVTLDAGRGYLVSEAGSLIDVHGASAVVDLPNAAGGTSPVTLAGSAGSVNLSAAAGMLLDGSYDARPGGTGGAGGKLTVALGESLNYGFSNVTGIDVPIPANPHRLVLQQGGTVLPPTLRPGDAIDSATFAGSAAIKADAIQAAGFDQATLTSKDAIVLHGDVKLALSRSLTLDTPVLSADAGARANLSAAYVALGSSDITQQPAAPAKPAAAGGANLAVQAGLMDIRGDSVVKGFDSVALTSRGDIRLIGTDKGALQAPGGSFAVAGPLTLDAAQVYPTTLSQFRVSSTDRIALANSTGRTAAVPFSAAGDVTLAAPVIVQDGTLRAPLGHIALSATDTLELGAGSLTSVAADGSTIPFGITQNGTTWVYPLGGVDLPIGAVPVKTVRLEGNTIAVNGAARIDLSGGGDLYGYEFVPGTGGSRDVLADPKVFAIVPNGTLAHGYAPYDPLYSKGSTLQPGDSIVLAAGGPVPAGTYTLLPARYALLPGAYAVTAAAGTQDLLPGTTLTRPDGSVLVAGRRSVDGGATIDSRWSGWQLTPSATLRTQSEFDDALASSFFAAAAAKANTVLPPLPADAGDLVVRAAQSLALAPETRFSFAPGSGGHGGEVDFDAARIAIVARRNDADAGLAGFVQLESDVLSHIGAERLTIGGARSSGDTSGLAVNASTVEIRTDAAHPLVAPDLVIAATGSVNVRSGSVLAGQGGSQAAANPLTVTGDGALVRLTAAPLPALRRTGASGAGGDLALEAGTTLQAAGSITLDATRQLALDPAAALDSPALRVDANRIGLGSAPAGAPGLILDGATLAHAAQLVLQSATSIDLYGDLALGASAPLGSLTLDAPALLGIGAGNRSIVARSIVLTDTGGGLGGTGVGTGSLALTAQAAADGSGGTLTLAGGSQRLEGFDTTRWQADRAIVAQGNGAFAVAGDLTLASARLTSDAGADQLVTAGGRLVIAGLPATGTAAAPAAAGGRLALAGSAVEVSGRIELPAGDLTVHAQGSAAGSDVRLLTGAWVGTPGYRATFRDTSATAAGGSIALLSDHGDVRIDSGATVDVSAAAGGDAGRLALTASQSSVLLGGAVEGTAAAGQHGGRLDVDARTLAAADLAALNAATAAGGFDEAYRLRVRSGDLALAAGERLAARQLTWSADSGNIAVAGSMLANGNADRPDAGSIALWAGQSVQLAAGGTLAADAASGGRAGSLTLGSANGSIDLAAGGTLSAAGGGKVLLRAPRTGSGAGSDVAIGPIAATVQGAGGVTIEAVKRYDGVAQVDASWLATVAADDASFQGNSAAILARITNGNAPLAALTHLRAGAEATNSGAISLPQALDLSKLRDAGGLEPGTLTLRAGGDLALAAALSDGFTVSRTGATVGTGDSWSYRLVAGADLAAADPLAVSGDRTRGSVTLAPTALVRTGTGSIDVAAAGDVVFQRNGTTGASLYTAGSAAATLGTDFTVPNYLSSGGTRIAAQYTENGGDVRVVAGGDVIGSGSTQTVDSWLYRQGQIDGNTGRFAVSARQPLQTSWWVQFDAFGQDLGALGGGNISVDAGGSVRNLSASAPTNGRLAFGRLADSAAPDLANLVVKGGGDLAVRAQGDVLGGAFYVARGNGTIASAGSIGADPAGGIAPIVALGDARMALAARRDVAIVTAYDPGLTPQSVRSQINLGPDEFSAGLRQSYFTTYTAGSRVDLQSVAGDVSIGQGYDNALGVLQPSGAFIQPAIANFDILPPTLDMAALQGSVAVGRAFTLAPAARGDLSVLAGRSIDFGSRGGFTLSDVDPATIANAAQPAPVPFSVSGGSANIRDQLNGAVNAFQGHAPTPLHAGDDTPVRLYATTGSIAGGGNAQTQIVAGKPIEIAAGQDVSGITVFAQNLRAGDVTLIEAGRDIVQPTPRIAATNAQLPDDSVFSVGGPGRIDVVAGHQIDLGTSQGVLTTGNVYNPALPAGGANIALLAGVGAGTGGAAAPAWAAFASKYIDPAGSLASADGQARLVAYMSRLLGVDAGTLDAASAWTAYAKLGRELQAPLIEQVLGDTLRQAGLDHNRKGTSYQAGYDAIATLFPGADYSGDITLYYSQIKTLRGGDITLLTPGGGVNAGLATTPAGAVKKPATDLGIVTAAGGDIRTVTDGNFQVNSSRVFTVGGGDVLMWSSHGNIDAGKGAKSTVLVPPPLVLIDPSGKVTIELQGAASGAGIGALLSGPGQKPGNVDLIAPAGEVNAGDAGIRAAGNLNIAAQVIRGADNISFGGVATGVPVADTSGLSAGLAGANVGKEASQSTDATTKRLADSAQAADELKKSFRPAFVTVEVTGLGDESDDDKDKKKRR